MKSIEGDLRRFAGMMVGLFVGGGALVAAPLSGDVVEVASDIIHANGNSYDQVLLTGATGAIGADPGQATRVSFVDLTGDIVQVEFSGKGTLTVSLENASGPAPAANYNQPDVAYMRGHAALVVSGSDASTNLTVFSVGRITALNSALFREDVTYDGFADLASLVITGEASGGASAFGSIRMGNVQFYATHGFTGIYAPDVAVQGTVVIGDIAARDDANPVLYFGEDSKFAAVTIAGGDLLQTNGRAIQLKGPRSLSMMPGTSSSGATLPFQFAHSTVEREGVNVTQETILYPLVSGQVIVTLTNGRVSVTIVSSGNSTSPVTTPVTPINVGLVVIAPTR